MDKIEQTLQEIGRNEFLEMEVERLNRENLGLKRRINGLQKREKHHKRIISKQNRRIQDFEQKQYYINVQKGVKRRK